MVLESGNGAFILGEHVDEVFIRRECDRARPASNCNRGGRMGREHTIGEVEYGNVFVHHAGHEEHAAGTLESNLVSLATRCDGRSCRLEATITTHREYTDVSSTIIGGEHPLTTRM